ncbi:hypothetical protein BJF77_07190 [Kocuria sp. CNJ-770]|nr:hypothetical protein BJF77_07190 [Kocuria sp. CNJ-770]
MPSRPLALGLADQALLRDHVVHDLALVGGQGFEVHPLPGLLGLPHGGEGHLLQRGGPAQAVAPDVEHEPRAASGRGQDGEPHELLQRLEDLPVLADEHGQALVVVALRDDGQVRAAVADLDVDVPVEVRRVQELLEVVGRDLALLLEGIERGIRCRVLVLAGLRGGVRRRVALDGVGGRLRLVGVLGGLPDVAHVVSCGRGSTGPGIPAPCGEEVAGMTRSGHPACFFFACCRCRFLPTGC